MRVLRTSGRPTMTRERWMAAFVPLMGAGRSGGFAEVVVSPPACERPGAEAASVEVAFGADIRVRIPVTTPANLACAIIKAVVAR